MKISAISDVHVKTSDDSAADLLLKFMRHPLVQSSDYVFFLGDIFDLMSGPHPEYLKKFEILFQEMNKLAEKGIKVYFFEGNHDVHLEKLFQKIWKDKLITPLQDPLVLDLAGKTYYFSHGDEHEVSNISYQRYKKIILSKPLKFVANYLMPYKVLSYVGEKASQKSRKKGSYRFDENKVRAKFREGVSEVTKGHFDFVLGGHSHVQDEYKISERSLYLNNGYALKSKTFIFIDNHKASFEPLS